MQRITTNKKILYPELSYKIVGLAFDVHNELGRFAREKQYADALEQRFKSEGVSYQREYSVGDSGNIVDFLVSGEGEILIELKTTRLLGRSHYRQLQNYLQRAKIELGLLINFSDKYLQPKRVLRLGGVDSQTFADSDKFAD